MKIMNKRRRIIFFAVMLLSVSIMVFFNVSSLVDSDDYSNRLNIICLIFLTALVFLLYIVYEAYRVMYEEMTERVNVITANKNDLQTIYNSIFMHLIEVNEEGIIININDSACSFLKHKRNYIIGKTITKILPMEAGAIDLIEQMIKKSFTEKTGISDEFETNGNIFEASVTVLHDSSDIERKVLLLLNDVTQERANYKQMMQDNKMIAVGHLASGVAHEIRNPLGLIRTYSHLLKKNPDDTEVREKAIPMIDYAVDRSSGIIDNLLGFSRLSGDSWNVVDLRETIESIIDLEEHESQGKDIRISVECREGLKFNTIVESLQIILVNLISNAIDAVEENGSVCIDCSETQEHLVITVSDTGSGIPDDIISDIFNPFFTTKKKEKGYGLGLYIVYNEVTKLNGKIEVESRQDEGTSFVVTFHRGSEDENE